MRCKSRLVRSLSRLFVPAILLLAVSSEELHCTGAAYAEDPLDIYFRFYGPGADRPRRSAASNFIIPGVTVPPFVPSRHYQPYPYYSLGGFYWNQAYWYDCPPYPIRVPGLR